MTKKMFIATIVAIVLAAFALPALAKPPDHFSDSYAEAPILVADCGDFELWTKGVQIYMDGTIHYDSEGNPIRIVTHWWAGGETYIWRPDTGQEAPLAAGNLFNSIDLLATGETISSGIQFKIKIPGEGTMLMDVGRMVFNPYPNLTFEKGQHPVWFPEEGAFDKLCAYFAE